MITDQQLVAAFSAFELGRLADAFSAEARAYPEAPANSLLRKLAREHLPWDHARQDCWRDPRWVASFELLRDEVIAAGDGKPLYSSEVDRLIPALVERLEALHEAGVFGE